VQKFWNNLWGNFLNVSTPQQYCPVCQNPHLVYPRDAV
jgi:hypothetical protein